MLDIFIGNVAKQKNLIRASKAARKAHLKTTQKKKTIIKKQVVKLQFLATLLC